jgi:hypothetical protein
MAGTEPATSRVDDPLPDPCTGVVSKTHAPVTGLESNDKSGTPREFPTARPPDLGVAPQIIGKERPTIAAKDIRVEARNH